MDSRKYLYFTLILVWLFSLLGVFTLTYKYEENKWGEKVTSLQKEAEKKYNQEILSVLERERNLQSAVQKLETEGNENVKQINSLRARNRQLIRDAGGLRDPGYGGSSGESKGTNSSSGIDPETNSRTIISRTTSDFLLDLAADADEVREQLRLCQEWAKTISK